MPIERPDRFDLKDLYIDVKLEALVDGEPFDFTGRKHFTAGFFKENIGFGITNIKVEVNTSLQPIVEITFMDLYGNTMFGGQYNDRNVDYSSFFRWPPPKFMFTFKGYLGRPVTWMLNLKQYDINFISQSGHYELKASFVPNQWGFFGDMPFLYLLAAKRLRMNENPNLPQEQAMSVFDLIKIGKQVEIKTAEVTKKYDVLIKKMSDMQSNLGAALADGKTVSFGERMVGEVDGQVIKGFNEIYITDVTSDPKFGVKSLDDILLSVKKPQDNTLMNQFLFTKMQINGVKGVYHDKSFSEFQVLSNDAKESEKKKYLEEIRKNILNINDEIKAGIFYSTKTELSQITISEIFRQIAKDSAYVMGRILEAGFKGNSNDERANPTDTSNVGNRFAGRGSGMVNRYDRRNSEESDVRPTIVGKYYPLADDDGEEVPALSENTGGLDYGITDAGCEMDFVREFINAVIEGIAQDLTEDEVATATSDEIVAARITNLEATLRNPYRPYYNSIAENILIRSGIAAYMTRSSDPNLPGDYSTTFNVDRQSPEDIRKLAQEDAKNITDNMIKSMSADESMKLEAFVDFFDKLLSEDGDDFLTSEGNNAVFLRDDVPAYRKTHDLDEPTPNEVLDYRVVMNFPSNTKPEDFNTQQKIQDAILAGTLASGDCRTFRDTALNGIIRNSGMRGLVDESSLTARKLVNNGMVYVYPHNVGDKYFYLVYQGDDARAVKAVNNTETDAEFSSTETDKDKSQPRGLVEIDRYYDEDGKVLDRIEEFNEIVENGLALDYSALKNVPVDFYRNDRFASGTDNIEFNASQTNNGLPPELDHLLWKKKVVNADPQNQSREIRAADIVYTVLYHKDSSDGIDTSRVVFGPFLQGTKGRNQRVFIKTLCAEIKKKIKKVQRDKQQVISRVLGNANEAENIIYKQMHSMFHQWSTIAYKDSISENGDFNGSSIPANGEGIAQDLEALYGGFDRHVEIKSRPAEDVQNLPDPAFIYDYPLQRIREVNGSTLDTIDVCDALINLDPLYKPDANTTVLNMLYNLCSKNNFMFIPIPGYAGYLNIKEIFRPYQGQSETRIRNFFHILFMPTPESRSMLSNKSHSTPLTFHDSDSQRDIKGDAIGITFGATDNQIVRNVSVGTRDNKVTAESIINLQRLTDKEDNNKTVTTDCSMLNVMAGRSYTSKIDTLGNAQIYPMQFYFLEKMPLFDGLYQIMKVEHNITPNDMTTTFEGIRMRFNPGSGNYFSIPPITLNTLQHLLDQRPRTNPVPDGFITDEEGKPFDPSTQAGENEVNDGTSVESVRANSNGSDSQVVNLLSYIKQAQNSNRLTNMGDDGPIVDNNGPNGLIADKGGIIQNMNDFIIDVLDPFAKFFKETDPTLFKKWTITSAARKWKSGKTTSQHLRGQAIDSSIVFNGNKAQGLIDNHKLLNYIMDFYRANPSLEYGQILMETRSTQGRPQIWIHWSYSRSGNHKQRIRFVNDVTLPGSPMNTGRGGPQLTSRMSMTEASMQNLLG